MITSEKGDSFVLSRYKGWVNGIGCQVIRQRYLVCETLNEGHEIPSTLFRNNSKAKGKVKRLVALSLQLCNTSCESLCEGLEQCKVVSTKMQRTAGYR